jgi:hypothetical protein
VASISDLELEVKRLRQRLHAAENAPAGRERAAVDELVGDGKRGDSECADCEHVGHHELKNLELCNRRKTN